MSLVRAQLRQIKRIGLIATVLGAGLVTVVGVSPASAHTGVLEVSGVCQSDGTRLVTYSGSTTNVPDSGTGHTAQLTVGEIQPSGSAVSPSTQTVVGNTSFSFTQTIPGDATAAQATAFLVWGDKAQSDPIGQATFPTACTPKVPVKPAPVVTVVSSDNTVCASKEVTTTTVTTTTGWELKDNVWVKTTPVVVTTTDTRPTTTEECPLLAEEKPEPIVETTSSDDTDCASKEVMTTTVTTTTGWELKDNVWVKTTPVVVTTTDTRPTTTTECPAAVPPTDVTTLDSQGIVLGISADSTPNPLPVAAAAGEAQATGQLITGGIAAFAAFIALGAGTVLRRRHREV